MSVLSWIKNQVYGKPTKQSNSNTGFVPYSNTNKAASTVPSNLYQYNSIVPFQNNANGIQAAYNTPGYEVSAANSYLLGGYDGTGGSGGSSTYNPQQAALDAQLQGYRSDATSRINNILSAYDSLIGGVDNVVRDKTSQLNQAYDKQNQDLNTAYENNQGALGSAYAGRGLGQSSFLGDALGQAAKDYQSNVDSITQNRGDALSSIGNYAATTKAKYNADKSNYASLLGQLGNYDLQGLTSLIPSLQNAYGNIQGEQAGQGTRQSFIDQVNGITPVANYGSDQLKARLDAVVGSGVPKYAKNQLAQGVMKQAGLNDPSQQSYWQNYFQQLLGA